MLQWRSVVSSVSRPVSGQAGKSRTQMRSVSRLVIGRYSARRALQARVVGARLLSAAKKGGSVDAEVISGDDEIDRSPANSTPKERAAPVNSETVTGSFEKQGFKAETLKLLDIVTHSLYSDKEVRGAVGGLRGGAPAF